MDETISSVSAIMSLIPVRPVDLHHRKLRVVVGIHGLIPEVAGDFEDLFEPPDHQAFKVEFWGNPQEQVLVEEVMVRGEWLGIGATVYRLEDGCLELEEPVVVEVPADERDNPVARLVRSACSPRSRSDQHTAGGNASRHR